MAWYLDDELYAVVMDNGSAWCKSGFAGDDEPITSIPACVGSPKYRVYPPCPDHKDGYVGDDAQVRRGILSLNYPIERGVIKDWDDMLSIWRYIYDTKLQVKPEDRPLLLTEAPMNPRSSKERMTEMVFEELCVPLYYVSIPAVLSVYASGRGCAVVLESGDAISHIVPIYEGYTVPHAIHRINLGGRDLTEYLARMMCSRGYPFDTPAAMETVQDLKENVGYVCMDYKQEVITASTTSNLQQAYQLPDCTEVIVDEERFSCPEALFDPSRMGMEYPGIHQSVHSVIQKCDIDLRSTLYCNIVPCGGNTLFPGLANRLQKELKSLAPQNTIIKVKECQEKYMAWIGGSILASLSTFWDRWIIKQEYDETGPSIVHRKCMY